MITSSNYEFFIHAQCFGGFYSTYEPVQKRWVQVFDAMLVRDAEGAASHYSFKIDDEGGMDELVLPLEGSVEWISQRAI
tara:strand:- start:32 stop:268 length:237 start_codon:yes stop_codon:yes gene_type:complete